MDIASRRAAAELGAAVLLVEHVPDDIGRMPVVLWLAADPLAALQRFATWWRSQFPGLIAIGVTGSVGKTTAKDAIAAALTAGNAGSCESSQFQQRNRASPDAALAYERAPRGSAGNGHVRCRRRRVPCPPGTAHNRLVLNVDSVHLERAGTIERIAQAKQEIIDTLPEDGIAVLNGDDPRVEAMRAAAPGQVITFGLQPTVELAGDGCRAARGWPRAHAPSIGRDFALRSPLPGRHHVYALLAAAAVLDATAYHSTASRRPCRPCGHRPHGSAFYVARVAARLLTIL